MRIESPAKGFYAEEESGFRRKMSQLFLMVSHQIQKQQGPETAKVPTRGRLFKLVGGFVLVKGAIFLFWVFEIFSE